MRFGAGHEEVWLPGATGSGPFDVANSWATAFAANYPEATVSLTSVGSGAAQEALWGDIDCEDKPVDAVCDQHVVTRTVWGIGDAPIKSSVYQEQQLLQLQEFPACAGAVAVVCSNEVTQDQLHHLHMTFEVLSGIFNRSIEYWDNAKLQDLNPNTTLPHERISVLVRSDSSGQTSIFTDALDYHEPTWPDEAVGKLPDWPLGDLVHPNERLQTCTNGNSSDVPYSFSVDGKSGISLGMLRVPYSIGYMETGYADRLTQFLTTIEMGEQGVADSFVVPNADSLRTTMGGLANQLNHDTLEVNLARADTPIGGYPISGYAYWYVKKSHDEFDSCYQAWLVCKFVEWSYTDPQAADLALVNGWVVPPETVVVRALEKLNEVECFDTETNRVISALSYIPPKYRAQKIVDKVLVSTVTVASTIVALVLAWSYFARRHKNGDHIWIVDVHELQFGQSPEVIGQGSFGLVLLATYRGTQVAVKRVAPPSHSIAKKNSSHLNSMFDSHMSSSGNNAGFMDGGHRKFSQTSSTLASSEDAFGSKPRSFHDMSVTNGDGTDTVRLKRGNMVFHSKTKSLNKADFRKEMRILARLRHPCITTLIGAVLDPAEEPMLVMEYMEHGSLYDVLHNDTIVLDEETITPIIQDISQGVRFLHSGIPPIVHGDLKAKNILVDRKFRAKVADFGLSQKVLGGACGTPFWMAPELLGGKSFNTIASDVYAFGIILYEAYSRKDPYHDDDRKIVLKEVMDPNINKRPPAPKYMPPHIQSLMKDCLEGLPGLRPSAKEVDDRLQRITTRDIANGDDPKSTKHRASNVSLFDIFPRHVAEALRDGREVEPEHKECVTLFFCDIVGFTDLATRLEPRQVAEMLDRLYTSFDDLSAKHEVFKVETIGDAYMAVTNLVKDQSSDHAKRIASFAIEAVEAANRTLINPNDPGMGFVNIRAGFHSGPIVADVVGNRNPRYCLFGDTVNTASRMEALSEPNRIQCTAEAFEHLKTQVPELPVCLRGSIRVKGKGLMTTYWVNEESATRPHRSHHVNLLGMVDESDERTSTATLQTEGLSPRSSVTSMKHSNSAVRRLCEDTTNSASGNDSNQLNGQASTVPSSVPAEQDVV